MAQLAVDQVLDAGDLGIAAGLTDLLFAEIGGRRILYALNRAEGELLEFSVAPDGTLTLVTTLPLSGSFSVGSDPELTLVGDRLAIAGLDPVAGAFVTLNTTGGLVAQSVDPAPGLLDAPAAFTLWSDQALLTGDAGGGVSLYRDAGAGLVHAASLADTADRYLADIAASAVLPGSGGAMIALASATENGVTLLAATPAGTLSVASSFGAAEGLPASTPTDIAAVTHAGRDHLVLASSGSSSLSILTVDPAGGMKLADHVLDSTATRFQSVQSVDAVTLGDFAYVAAGGSDGGVTLFTLLPDGRLIHLATVTDTAATTLYRVSSVSLFATSGTLNLAVTSQWEAGVTRLAYDIGNLGAVFVMEDGDPGQGTSDDDQIIGTDVGDTISGGSGDDILSDGAGSDVLTGGFGADLFVFAADGVADQVTDYRKGQDRLDLSAWDFLTDVSQLTVTPTANGAILSFRDEVIEITTFDGAPLSAADFTNADILNVDRPSFLPIDQTLKGGPLGDFLKGGAGDDVIQGNDGADFLFGAFGADILSGGDGADTLDGGAGNDTLQGDAANDSIAGGEGDDLIDGGAGSDIIYGDAFDMI
ncbi:hypothetical protein GQ651_09550 [Alphaproteobacteria bacterium GH1-50]|uniref:Hemolysin type calcium-binding protein n=1 Tax=Kangsaoukella pontilimi TaxID=2691042 RepID=A0A7C9ISL6_9RHOB|nr:hypothetical protein [Kangsaoukella pontilimi]MXQ08085.1 hypothetical protein [Kangsaoukella pontilimi]